MKPSLKKALSVTARFLFAFALTIGFVVLGILAKKHLSESATTAFAVLMIASFALFLLLVILNVALGTRYAKKQDRSVAEMQEYYLARKEHAEEDLNAAVKRIVSLRRAISLYRVFVFLLCGVLGFSTGMVIPNGGSGTVIYLILFATFYGLAERLRLFERKYDFSGYAAVSDYPKLHEIAHRAARMLGKDGNIRILLDGSSNAGIAKFGKTYSLQLGVQLLNVLSEEEFTCILLHEFAHMTKDANPSDREAALFNFLTSEDNSPIFPQITGLLFQYSENVFCFEYAIYRLVASVGIERIADQALTESPDISKAASALIKTEYLELFALEESAFLPENLYESEQPRENCATVLQEAFRRAFAERRAFWDHIIAVEIQPRVSSHPIQRDRLAAIGAGETYQVSLPENTGAFREECEKALREMDRKVAENLREGYAEKREEYYLKPQRTVAGWESAGKKIPVEESRPVLDALFSLNRYEEALAYCEEIIREAPEIQTAHAHYIKGMILRERWDRGCIEELYRAMDINPNYISALETIGQFCCLMGLQDDLEEYRRRAPVYGQDQIDKYDETGKLNTKDDLSPEHLPDGMLEQILSHIRQVENGCLEEIYLIHKQITPEFFSSVFVIRYRQDTDAKTAQEVYDKIFNYLDAYPVDWQFSLFEYDAGISAILKRLPDCCVYRALGES